jgi:formylglycine-generating enzyme required for sulfatase activity
MAGEAGDAKSSESRAKIFISYSRKDLEFVDRLEIALKARGFEPLIDRTEIYAFEDWWRRIEGLIGKADTIIFVLSPDAIASEICTKEVTYAASLNKRFAPIICRQVQVDTVPEPLRRLNFILFGDPSNFETSIDQLAEALKIDIAWIRQHTEFGQAARRWASAGRPGPRGLLLQPPVLEEAERWIASRPSATPEPTEETKAFIAESRRAEIAARAARRRIRALIYVLLTGIIAGLVGWMNQSRIREQWRLHSTVRPFIDANIRPYVLTAEAERSLKPDANKSFRECNPTEGVLSRDHCPEMIVVPAGSFIMGSPPSEKGRGPNEGPQRKVTIERQFAVSKFEVTFSEWDTCVAYGDCDPNVKASWGSQDVPVTNVSWDDAQVYVAWLSKVTGKPYRLLSEAEYEYAARAGTQTAYPWGNAVGRNNANCDGCGFIESGRPANVRSAGPPNRFGLRHMVGNVWEWVQDCYRRDLEFTPSNGSAWDGWMECGPSPDHDRVIRGGSFRSGPQDIRSAKRSFATQANQHDDIGFRVARTLTAP